MSAPGVLLLESLHADARAVLDASAVVFQLGQPDAGLEDVPVNEIEGLITRGRGQVDAALLSELPSLRVIARAGVGLDNVDLALARERGIPVLNVPNALTTTVAEHAVALALAARRDVVAMARAARSGDWSARERYAGGSIAGARVAVIGMGAIGQRTATLFRALGAEVVTWNRTRLEGAGSEPDLDRALESADVVSLHVALTPDTRHLMDGTRLGRLAEGATVVNTARPSIVHRDAMLEALSSGQVARYAVDGFEPEPPRADDPLLVHPGVIVTPHTAALTQETFSNLCLATVEGVLSLLAGSVPTRGARVVP